MNDERSMERLARRLFPAALADAWVRLMRPGLCLRCAEEDEPLVGQLGGVPELPEDSSWPEWEGRPLNFVADIDCRQLPSYRLGMPAAGTLLFFKVDERAGDVPTTNRWWQAERLDQARVVYVPSGTPVAERDTPDGIESYRMVPLTGELRVTGPYWNHPLFEEAVARMGAADRAFMADPDNMDQFRAAMGDHAPIPRHQFGGHAHPIQDSVELQLAYALLGGKVSHDDPALVREARRWRLLAQIDSDDQVGMMWGDVGTLYWLIRSDDLTARRFNAALCTEQCT